MRKFVGTDSPATRVKRSSGTFQLHSHPPVCRLTLVHASRSKSSSSSSSSWMVASAWLFSTTAAACDLQEENQWEGTSLNSTKTRPCLPIIVLGIIAAWQNQAEAQAQAEAGRRLQGRSLSCTTYMLRDESLDGMTRAGGEGVSGRRARGMA